MESSNLKILFVASFKLTYFCKNILIKRTKISQLKLFYRAIANTALS